jgi:hypothetical protein
LEDADARKLIFDADAVDAAHTMSGGNVARPAALVRARDYEATLGRRILSTDTEESGKRINLLNFATIVAPQDEDTVLFSTIEDNETAESQ